MLTFLLFSGHFNDEQVMKYLGQGNLDIIIVSIMCIKEQVETKSASQVYEKIRQLPNFGDDGPSGTFFYELKASEEDDLFDEDDNAPYVPPKPTE